MANLKISELPQVTSINNFYEFAVVDTDTMTTSKVTITGMTLNNGRASIFPLSNDYSLAAPYSVLGDGNEFTFTADTINVKKYTGYACVSVFMNYYTDSVSTGSTFYVDIAGDSSAALYLPGHTVEYTTVSVTFRPLDVVQGNNTIELRMTLENGVTYYFGSVYMSAFEI